MRRIAGSKIVLAIIGIALLLLNPYGSCAATGATQPSTHPCCPKPAGSQPDNPGAGVCMCVDREPAASSVPSFGDELQPAASNAILLPAIDLPARETCASAPAVFGTDESVLQYRQLRI